MSSNWFECHVLAVDKAVVWGKAVKPNTSARVLSTTLANSRPHFNAVIAVGKEHQQINKFARHYGPRQQSSSTVGIAGAMT